MVGYEQGVRRDLALLSRDQMVVCLSHTATLHPTETETFYIRQMDVEEG